MAEFWPQAGRDESLPEPTRALARFMNGSRKILFTRTLDDISGWENTEKADAPIDEVVAREKARDGKDMVILAGASMAQTALRADAVDELWLLTLPELFGHGTRLFEGNNLRRRLSLLEVEPMDTGAVLTRYAVQAA